MSNYAIRYVRKNHMRSNLFISSVHGFDGSLVSLGDQLILLNNHRRITGEQIIHHRRGIGT